MTPRTVGVIAVGRPTFDLDLGRTQASAAIDALTAAGIDVVGDAEPVLEPEAVGPAISRWPAQPDLVVVLQATFTDSRFVEEVFAATPIDVGVWAFPERRGGGRLRLNSLCGMILASFAAGVADRPMRHLYLDPGAAASGDRIRRWIEDDLVPRPPISLPAAGEVGPAARAVLDRLSGSQIGVVGDPPPGFGPCRVQPDAEVLVRRAGVKLEPTPIGPVLARVGPDARPARPDLPGVGELDGRAVARAVELRTVLHDLADESRWDALAVRCWPETFDELGCAACAALAELNEGGLPAGCEADALGALTMLVLGWLGETRPFLADLVDADPGDDTAAVWHCGVAPADMAAPDTVRAGVHPNRQVPLVQLSALRPGTATVARLSQSRGVPRMVVGRVEVLDAPCPYVGSGGIVRFERPVDAVLETVLAEGLEHHLALVYGDVVDDVRGLAAGLGVPIVEL
ncbi:MAG: hypothetical protein QNJ12_07475 [Ilumatobacter sp.]|uniref:hypothetical protein n=1 Tax=Ilumatobacter sp. TaxID=1967498 RepID=UPI0026058710|nr:hypothetical protein [Ilumatobacter sp.]MDJ0768618.1 hypothetical protein [Ilumatobacter sp.]